jgi:glycosyltransferase involved in cell wall biosynthesis
MQEKLPKVSVCVVTYNQEKYIRQCLQSIVDQKTDFNFEVIVGDDGSTDNTRTIISEFAEKYPCVKTHYHKENIGPCKNFVATHNMANGEFVAHCDGDDLFLPGKLQKQVTFLIENVDCTVTWHKVNYFDDFGGFASGEGIDYTIFKEGKITIDMALRFGYFATHSSIMYRKSARKTIDPKFDTLDMFYTWEYLCSGWGHILNDVLGEYRINASGAITNANSFNIRALCAHHSKFYLEKLPEKKEDIFIYALSGFLVDLKNRKRTALKFLSVALRSFSLISPMTFVEHMKTIKKFRFPILSQARK